MHLGIIVFIKLLIYHCLFQNITKLWVGAYRVCTETEATETMKANQMTKLKQ